MFFWDPTFVLLIPALILSFWAQWKVQHTYRQMSRVRASSGRTGREVARAILTRNGLSDVGVEPVAGVLTDHYDPRVRKVRLSEMNYGGDSVAAVAVSAHEIGHVLQHAQGYAPMQVRAAIVPVVNLASMAAFPVFLIGLIFQSGMSLFFMDLGILLFTAVLVFHLVTLPVEFNASRRALAQLTEMGTVAPEEVRGAKKVLDAAALTYVAAAAMSALQILRLLILRSSRD
jgi:Zn-dependent membrane protease YugP